MKNDKFEKILKEKLSYEVDEKFDTTFWKKIEDEKEVAPTIIEIMMSFFQNNFKIVAPTFVAAILLIILNSPFKISDKEIQKSLVMSSSQELLENVDLFIVMEENSLSEAELDILFEGLEEES